jgi:site-specific DNA-methyltransferase (adenine-specific)
MFRYEWIWRKNIPVGFTLVNKQPMRTHEYVLIFSKKGCVYYPQFTKGKPYTQNHPPNRCSNYRNFGAKATVNPGTRYPVSILEFPKDKDKYHPTQKPVALCEYLIKTYTKENDVVLDNCAGSGSTLVAAKNINRQFIGIEKDETYFNIILQRLKRNTNTNKPEHLWEQLLTE